MKAISCRLLSRSCSSRLRPDKGLNCVQPARQTNKPIGNTQNYSSEHFFGERSCKFSPRRSLLIYDIDSSISEIGTKDDNIENILFVWFFVYFFGTVPNTMRSERSLPLFARSFETFNSSIHHSARIFVWTFGLVALAGQCKFKLSRLDRIEA